MAREAANSYWVMPIDNELIPSPGVVPSFLEMIAKGNKSAMPKDKPRVFVLPAFDIKQDYPIPKNKKQFKDYYKKGLIVPFGYGYHQYLFPTENQVTTIFSFFSSTHYTEVYGPAWVNLPLSGNSISFTIIFNQMQSEHSTS